MADNKNEINHNELDEKQLGKVSGGFVALDRYVRGDGCCENFVCSRCGKTWADNYGPGEDPYGDGAPPSHECIDMQVRTVCYRCKYYIEDDSHCGYYLQ